MIRSTSTLRSIALEQPATIRVFEHFHLDYCCGGNRPLAEACVSKGLATEDVLAALEEMSLRENKRFTATEDLAAATPTAIVRYIVETHHNYVRSELPRLLPMAEKVASRHGAAHPEVLEIADKLRELASELTAHLRKEETILFPYIEALDRRGNGEAAPDACFGSVESPIRVMVNEHEAAGSLMEAMRAASGNFTPPAGACPTYAGFYDGLAAFERDLHRHVHLENNLLFPRAIVLEKEILSAC